MDQIDSVVSLLYRWPDLIQAGVEFPEVEVMSIPTSPELIEVGNKLFNIACKSCHGVDGYGSPMAPALNNQIFLAETPDAAIYQITAGGVPGTLMPAWGNRLISGVLAQPGALGSPDRTAHSGPLIIVPSIPHA